MKLDTVDTVLQKCECNSYGCALFVVLSVERTSLRRHDHILIVDGCLRGPEPTDVLVEKRDGYSIYREGGVSD